MQWVQLNFIAHQLVFLDSSLKKIKCWDVQFVCCGCTIFPFQWCIQYFFAIWPCCRGCLKDNLFAWPLISLRQNVLYHCVSTTGTQRRWVDFEHAHLCTWRCMISNVSAARTGAKSVGNFIIVPREVMQRWNMSLFNKWRCSCACSSDYIWNQI